VDIRTICGRKSDTYVSGKTQENEHQQFQINVVHWPVIAPGFAKRHSHRYPIFVHGMPKSCAEGH